MLCVYRYCFYLISSILSVGALKLRSSTYLIGKCGALLFCSGVAVHLMQFYIAYKCTADSVVDEVMGFSCDTSIFAHITGGYVWEYITEDSIVLIVSMVSLSIMWTVHMKSQEPAVQFPYSRQHLLSCNSDQFISADEGGYDHTSPKTVHTSACLYLMHLFIRRHIIICFTHPAPLLLQAWSNHRVSYPRKKAGRSRIYK